MKASCLSVGARSSARAEFAEMQRTAATVTVAIRMVGAQLLMPVSS
ncbi:MAG: hypothetical protein RIC55_15700 [Pirellulaceae bacterium]